MINSELYSSRDARLDTIVGDGKAYWAMLGRIMLDHPVEWNFRDWCEDQHGFRMIYDEEGHITTQPEIIDAQKYTLCLLKYGG